MKIGIGAQIEVQRDLAANEQKVKAALGESREATS